MSKKRQKKFPRDPAAPKRAASAYFLFMADIREEVKQAHPGSKMSHITKEIAVKYRALTAEEKKPYDDEAKTLKKAYDEKFAEYKSSGKHAAYTAKKKAFKAAQKGGAEIKQGKNGKLKFGRDTNEPKRSPSAYFCFMNEKRPAFMKENPGSRVGAIAKALGKAWRELQENQKTKYQAEAKKLKAKYLEAMEDYRETDEYATYQAAKKKFQDDQKPKKPTSSPRKSGRKPGRRARRYVESDGEDDEGTMSDVHSDEPEQYSEEEVEDPEPSEASD